MNMRVKARKHKTYASFVFFIFAFFFVSPALSPAIGGNTIYLSWFIPFLDINFDVHFINKIATMKAKKNAVIAVYFLIIIIILHGNYMFFIKVLSIAFSVFYLQYSYTRLGFKKLYTAFNINIFIAVLQFILYFVNSEISHIIGPSNISRIFWGKYSTQTNTNFYPVFYFPRTCGLSREAGFFAALLCVIIIIYTVDTNIKKSRIQKLLFFIAYIVSFSKMSVALPAMLVVLRYRKQINRVSLMKITLLFVFIMGILVNYLSQSGSFRLLGGSIAHRLWGYEMIFNRLGIREFFIGNAHGARGLNRDTLHAFSFYNELETHGWTTFCGLPSLVIYTGYIGLIGFLILMKSLKVKSSYFMILIIATIDVDFTTATSFVVLAYWLTVYASRKGFYL